MGQPAPRAGRAARALALAIGCLSLVAGAARAAPDEAHEAIETEQAPALHGETFQRSTSTFDIRRQGDIVHRVTSLEPGSPGTQLQSTLLRDWARGTLLRSQLSEDTSLSLRWRGGKLGLYLAIELTGRP